MKKLFTLLTLALLSIGTAWAATENLGASASDKTAYSGISFTTSANMMTTNKSGDYIKVRTNQDTPQWTFTVKAGYKITGFKVVGYSNNSLEVASIEMTSLCIDGGDNILTGSDLKTFTVDKNNPITLDKSGFEATSSITCTFNNSNITSEQGRKNAQLMVKITITYEETGTPVTLSFSETSANANLGEDFTEPTLTIAPVAASSEVIYSSSNTEVATVNATSGEVTILGAGTTTITAAISGSATYVNASASYTLNVIDPYAKSVKYSPASSANFAGGATENIQNGTETVATITYSEAEAEKFSFNKDGATYDGIEFAALTEGNGTNGNQSKGTFYTIVPKYDGNIKMAVIINKDRTFVVEENGTPLGGFSSEADKFYGIKNFNVKAGKSYKCYVSGSKMGFYGLVYSYSTAEVSTLSGRNYATYVTTKKLDFSAADGITAYIATGLNGAKDAVVLEEVNVVPAGTPIIVKTDTKGATVNVPVTTADADDVTGNKLVAGDGTAATTEHYFLKEDMFHQATTGTLKSGKAYLHITTPAPVLNIEFTGNMTGIDIVSQKEEVRGQFYDLQGRKVAQPTKGLYIVNGKKVIIK